MVIGVQMMSSCESDGKWLDQPGGAPPKEGSILDSWTKLVLLGTKFVSAQS